jgi:anaerobic selenocysteine-containing dehydrogenase
VKKTRTTCPRDCYDACGVVVEQRADRLVVRGDPSHPVSRGRLCRKCTIAYNGVVQDREARLRAPLRRLGPKGAGAFEAISWDEALGTIGARLGAVIAEHGGATVTNVHYTGTCGLLQYSFPLRLVRCIGATEVEPDTVCNMAGHVALRYLWGSGLIGFDPRTARDSRCILVWGANPSASAPHAHDHWLPESPATTVVVDPIKTPTAKQADLHLQPFPGTDAALAFAIANVLKQDGLIDTEFLASRTTGWKEIEPLIDACTTEWAEAETGVPAGHIEKAAHLYGHGPSLLWVGQGLQRQPRGGNVMRAVAMLPALTGNVGKPGAGFLYLNGGGTRGIDYDYLEARHLAPDMPTVSHMDLADHLADPARARALLVWNMNPAASNPEQARLRASLQRDDLFTVVIDLFQTDTADFADLVLPAASFLECDDLIKSYFDLSISAQVRVADPPGDSLQNTEIFRRIARALGRDEPELYESDASIIETLLARSVAEVTWAELAQKGTVWITDEPIVQFADQVFPTPSGKVELASTAAEAAGHPRTPLPAVDDRPSDGSLRLLSPASPWSMNSTFANDPKLKRKLGRPTVSIHPDDARVRALTNGDRVRITNGTGTLLAHVVVTEDVPPGVAYAPKGRWPRLEPNRANVNSLVPAAKSDMGESTCVHATEVTIAKVSTR